ncbi:hypothetical protein GCM10010349_49870 [Streptomyces flavofungini]|nr:hypothetical protein GCM10010349_49870 [Streptomyces flavofungini]
MAARPAVVVRRKRRRAESAYEKRPAAPAYVPVGRGAVFPFWTEPDRLPGSRILKLAPKLAPERRSGPVLISQYRT